MEKNGKILICREVGKKSFISNALIYAELPGAALVF